MMTLGRIDYEEGLHRGDTNLKTKGLVIRAKGLIGMTNPPRADEQRSFIHTHETTTDGSSTYPQFGVSYELTEGEQATLETIREPRRSKPSIPWVRPERRRGRIYTGYRWKAK
jgi:hypothetical protein